MTFELRIIFIQEHEVDLDSCQSSGPAATASMYEIQRSLMKL